MIQITWKPNLPKLFRGLVAAGNALLDFVYPPHCLLCRKPLDGETQGLCPGCWLELACVTGPRCDRCGCPGVVDVGRCPNCLDKVFAFSRMRSLSPFNPSVQRLIHMLKYQGKTSVGKALGRELAVRTRGTVLVRRRPLVVPVPLHGSRRRERGYNQSALIARALGKQLDLTVREDVLKRVRLTTTQTALDQEGRRSNVDGAFRVRRGDAVRERCVLLVDDVLTTGATVNACAEALAAAGAGPISVAVLASPYFEEADGHNGRGEEASPRKTRKARKEKRDVKGEGRSEFGGPTHGGSI